MSPTPLTRRSSRSHTSTSTRMTLNLRHTDPEQSRYTRRTTPTIGTLPSAQRTSQTYSSTISHKHSTSPSHRFNINNTTTRTSKRARPRWYRPPPPEAYLIIRAHRRPIGGWGEDWSRKGDGWTFKLSIISKYGDDGLVIRLEVRDQDSNIVYPDDHILSLRLTRMILQYRVISATPTMTGIMTSRISSEGGEKIIVFALGNILSTYGKVVEIRLFDLGLCVTRGRCSSIASLRIS